VSGDIRVVDDPQELIDLYAPDAVVHPYGLADLDEPFWSSSTWYRRGDAVVAVLDLGGDDAVYAIAADDEKAAATLELLADVVGDLPEQYLITGPVGVTDPLRGRYAVEWVGPHVKMHLAEPDRLPEPDAGVEWLTRDDADDVIALRATDHDVSAFFIPELLDSGLYGGLRVDGALVAIAGVHVISEHHGVAAIGNVFTHPDHRGAGLASTLTATVARRLLDRVPVIGLNVGTDNAAARTVYRRLGFVEVLPYEEAELRRVQ
jgi:ribosomal protein S18 acetylase RimI-like enzyme